MIIRYDTIEEFNVGSKAEYTAQSSTRSQKLKQTKQCPFNSVQVKIREVSPEELVLVCYFNRAGVWGGASKYDIIL